ncbi:MAG: hypothetical protein JJV88_05545, partial [Sulfurovum sp.]|nr:hypothetical protein [Sulfurovaceae bacterium]
MDSYELGFMIGRILPILMGFGLVWLVFKSIKAIFDMIFENEAKETIKEYLFWVDFVQDVKSVEDFKGRLQQIKSKKVYKDKFNSFYLTKYEATAQNIQVEEITIEEVLKSEVYPLLLIKSCERITLYDKEDLKNIDRKCEVVWLTVFGINMHFVLRKKSIVYPKSYDNESKYRFGYVKIYNTKGYAGVYDVEADKLVLPMVYKTINCFGNIVAVEFLDGKYGVFELESGKKLLESDREIFPELMPELKEKINLSKIEIEDYIKLFSLLKSRQDLEQIGLWGAKVGVFEVPEQFKDIIEDSSSGTIEWNHYSGADVYNMSVELPVNFKKKNGEYVSLGIKIEYLMLESEYREKLTQIKGLYQEKENQYENKVLPNWLMIKNQQLDDVNFSNNTVDEIIKLDNEEFGELVNSADSGLLFTYFSTVSDDEMKR